MLQACDLSLTGSMDPHQFAPTDGKQSPPPINVDWVEDLCRELRAPRQEGAPELLFLTDLSAATAAMPGIFALLLIKPSCQSLWSISIFLGFKPSCQQSFSCLCGLIFGHWAANPGWEPKLVDSAATYTAAILSTDLLGCCEHILSDYFSQIFPG